MNQHPLFTLNKSFMIPFQQPRPYISESRLAAFKLPSLVNGKTIEPKRIGNVMAGTKEPIMFKKVK